IEDFLPCSFLVGTESRALRQENKKRKSEITGQNYETLVRRRSNYQIVLFHISLVHRHCVPPTYISLSSETGGLTPKSGPLPIMRGFRRACKNSRRIRENQLLRYSPSTLAGIRVEAPLGLRHSGEPPESFFR